MTDERVIAPYSRSYERELETENESLRERIKALADIEEAAIELDATYRCWEAANIRFWSAVKSL